MAKPTPRAIIAAALVAFSGAFLGLATPGAQAADLSKTVLANTAWPMYGHDSKHTFRSSLTGPTSANMLPPLGLGDKITTSPSVTPDGIFLVGVGFRMKGVRADGQILWKRTQVDARYSSPVIDTNGFFYYGERGNNLWKRKYESGAKICKKYIATDSDIRSSPTISTIYADRVYVTDGDNFLYAIGTSGDVGECNIIWSFHLDGNSMASVSLADSVPGNGDGKGNLVVIGTRSVYLISDEGDHPRLVVRRRIASIMSGPSPLIHPTTGTIYLGAYNGKFYALNPSTLATMPGFPVKVGSRVYSSASLSPDNQTVYVPSRMGSLYAIDAATGAVRPNFPYVAPETPRYPRGFAAVIDGVGNIFLGGKTRTIRALRPDASEIWSAHVDQPATFPGVITDGGFVVGALDHHLYRFCSDPTGPATATRVCGFTVDTTDKAPR
jgi:outer membrane protein assembly factor BamB